MRGRLAAFQRRWVSYDRADLTHEALMRRVEACLGEDEYGKRLRIDPEQKTISTAAGSLPLSPVLDPAWIKSRRRQKKADPGKPMGRFRKKLANNPYARALETPIRKCPNTAAYLPRYFLQDFELVKHPSTGSPYTGSPWWVPGPMSFGLSGSRYSGPAGSGADGNQGCRRGRGPITSYTLCRKSVVDLVGGPAKRHAALLLAGRSGMAVTPDTRNHVWRKDMGDVLLAMLRRHAVDALIARSCPAGEPKDKFIHPCSSWDDVGSVRLRGCVLWLPDESTARQYATLDIEGARYARKVAVHNLTWLLGRDELRRLRDEAPLFREHKVLVLTQWRSMSMLHLHLLLWRLQGYLADTTLGEPA